MAGGGSRFAHTGRFHLGRFKLGGRFSGFLGGGRVSRLIRKPDGTVTIQRLAPTWKPVLTRNPDGTVTISGSNTMQQFRVRLNEGAWAYYNEVIPYDLEDVTADDAVDVEAIGAAVSLGAVVAPTLSALTLSSAAITESAAAGALVGTIQGVTSGSTLSLTDDAEGLFEISGGDIVTAGALDYETATSHDITIRETLAGATNTPRDTTLTITVTNVQEVTLTDLTLSASSVAEDASEGSIVGAVQGRTSGGSIELTDDAGGLFALAGSNLVTADALDFETAESHEIEITETHPDGAPRTTTLTITVTDVDEGGVATLTLTADDPAFTAGSGGNPAQIDFTIVYDGADDLTGYLVTSDSATPPSAAEIIAGSGTGIIEGISWSETEGSLDLTGLTSASNGDKYLYIVIKEDAGDAVSDVLSITATGLDFTNPAHSSAATSTDGGTVTATMTEGMVGTENTANWPVKVNGVARTVSAVSISGADIALSVTPPIENGDTVTYGYSGGDLEDVQGNPLGTITDQAVTNNVPAAGLAYTYLGEYEWNTNSGTTGQYSSATSAFGADGTLYIEIGIQGGNSPKNIITSIEASGKLASVATDGVTSAETASANVTRAAIYKVAVLSTDSGIEINLENATDGTPLDASTLVSARLVLVTSAHSATDVTTAVGTSTGAPWTGNLDINTASGGLVLSVLATSDAAVPFDTFTGVTQLGTDHNSAGGLAGACVAGLASNVAAATPRTVRIGDTTTSTVRYAAVSLSLEAA